MESRFYIIVFGSLGAVLSIFISGFFMPSPWAPIMITLGALGGIAWLIAAFYLASALNSDI